MDTSAVDSMVGDICSDPLAARDLHDLLAVIAVRNDIEPDDRELERGTRFVIAYIEQVPYMLKVARTSASNVGLEKEIDCILETVVGYWMEGDDVIPDDLGCDHRNGLRNHRVDLPRHDARSGLQRGQLDLADAGERPRIHQAQIVGDFHQAAGQGFQLPRKLDRRVL